MLAHPADFPLQPVTQAFRAPTDNDKSFGNWLAKDWSLHQMDNPRISLDSFKHESVRTERSLSGFKPGIAIKKV